MNNHTTEELNITAMELLQAGDEDALRKLAEDNGLDQEDVDDYMDGIITELCTDISASLGKLKVEKNELQLGGILAEWAEEIEANCTGATFAKAVMQKDKSLAEYIAKLAEDGFKNKVIVCKEIVEKSKLISNFTNGREFSIGVPNKRVRKDIMIEYYMGEKE